MEVSRQQQCAEGRNPQREPQALQKRGVDVQSNYLLSRDTSGCLKLVTLLGSQKRKKQHKSLEKRGLNN